jgi:hypothetical protein
MNSASEANDPPSLIGRALHRMAVFLVAICIGIAGTLAWQSPGNDSAKQKMANWTRLQGWMSSAKSLAPGTDKAVEQPNPPAQGSSRDAPPPRAGAATSIAPAIASEEVQQLEAMATRYLAVVRQNVEQLMTDQKQLAADQMQIAADQKQLATDQKQMVADQKQVAARQEQMGADQKQVAARQEQMARDIADLQTAMQNIQNRISAPEPAARKPARRPRP